MREFLFRGKRKNNNEWLIAGGFDQFDNSFYIFCEDEGDSMEVIPETFCQFTGLKDKNGKRIFEGDILKFSDVECGDELQLVFYSEEDGAFFCKNNHTCYSDFLGDSSELELIGNRYDNPELLWDATK